MGIVEARLGQGRVSGRPALLAMIPAMLLALLYGIVRFLLDLLNQRQKAEANLQIEVLALHHQLRVLERHVRRPRFQTGDRLLRRHAVPPAPRRGQLSWREFVRQHADQILAVDFFSVTRSG